MTYAGYILGFPADTPESIVRDIKIIQRELPVDLLEFFILTPLPGSEDHKKLFTAGVRDGPGHEQIRCRATSPPRHPKMSQGGVGAGLRSGWKTYYTPEHMETVMRRAAASGISVGKMMFLLLWFYGCVTIEGIHPLEGGYLRRKIRTDRRPGLPREAVLPFYAGYAAETVAKHWAFAKLWWKFNAVRRRIKADPARRAYTDLALTPVTDHEMDELEMFATDSGKAAVQTARKRAAMRIAAAE